MSSAITSNQFDQLQNFPERYTRVFMYSRFGDMSYQDNQYLTGQRRRLSEFFAAAGQSSLRFGLLGEALELIDTFWENGALDRQKLVCLTNALQNEIALMSSIHADYVRGGAAGKDGAGPEALHVMRYAADLLDACVLVQEQDIREEMKIRLWARPKDECETDPDWTLIAGF